MSSFDNPDDYAPEDLGSIDEALNAPRLDLELDFDKIFNDYIASTQKSWAHDRKKVLGASETFGCVRKAWYSRNGTKKDADYKESWGATRRGDLIENYHVVPAMAFLPPGVKILYAGDDQETLFHPEVPLSATPDGLIINLPRNALRKLGVEDIESDCIAFEIKSIDPRVNLQEEKAIHHGQTQIQLGLFNDTTKYKPVYSVILYINASFLDDMSPFVVKFNPKLYEDAKARATAVFTVKDPLHLMREGAFNGGCDYCPFVGTCLKDMKTGLPVQGKKKKGEDTPPKLVEEADKLAREYGEVQREMKKLEKRKGELQETIKMTLRDHGKNRAEADDWKISYSGSDGRKTLDKEAMEADGIDLSKYEKEGNPYEILRITFKGSDVADDV